MEYIVDSQMVSADSKQKTKAKREKKILLTEPTLRKRERLFVRR